MKAEISKSFQWMLDQLIKWQNELKNSEVRIIFKEGGVTQIDKKDSYRPKEDNK